MSKSSTSTNTSELLVNTTQSSNAESPKVTQVSNLTPESIFQQSRSLSLQNNISYGNKLSNNGRKELLLNESKSKITLFANSFGRTLDKNMANIVSLQKECVHMLESFHQLKDQLYSFETEMNKQMESLSDNFQHGTASVTVTQPTTTTSNCVVSEKPQNDNFPTTIITNGYQRVNHQTINESIDRQRLSNDNKQQPEVSSNQQIPDTNQETSTILSHHNQIINQNRESTLNHHENSSSLSRRNEGKQQSHEKSLNTTTLPVSSKTPSCPGNEQDESFSQSTYIFSPHHISSDESSATSSSDQRNTNNNKGKSTLDSVLSSMNFHPKRKSSQNNTPSSSAPIKKKPFSPMQQQNEIKQKQSEFFKKLKSLRDQSCDSLTELPSNHILSIPSTSDEDNGDFFSRNDDPTKPSCHLQGQRRTVISPTRQIIFPPPPSEVRIKEEVIEENDERVSDESNVNFEISAIQKNSSDIWSTSTTQPSTTSSCNGERNTNRDFDKDKKFDPNIFGQRYVFVLLYIKICFYCFTGFLLSFLNPEIMGWDRKMSSYSPVCAF